MINLDEGWHTAAGRYSDFLRRHENAAVLFLELGVGRNTPAIIKYPFWRMTAANDKATYACINLGEAVCPREIEKRAVCIDGDIMSVMDALGRSGDIGAIPPASALSFQNFFPDFPELLYSGSLLCYSIIDTLENR